MLQDKGCVLPKSAKRSVHHYYLKGLSRPRVAGLPVAGESVPGRDGLSARFSLRVRELGEDARAGPDDDNARNSAGAAIVAERAEASSAASREDASDDAHAGSSDEKIGDCPHFVIDEVDYTASTCVVLLAVCERLAERARGGTMASASAISPADLIADFADIPSAKFDRAILAVAALRSALIKAREHAGDVSSPSHSEGVSV
ncbi:iron-sulfur cluster assembly scaffold protein [bacterium]|nr:iron-sulfur cluster assembly scaffold protein [bacterium]